MFFEFSIKDFIDIFCVASLLYYLYKLMKASGSINVFVGILLFILLWVIVSQVFEMRLLGGIFDKLVSVGVLALMIIFQEEIRRFLFTLGAYGKATSIFHNLFGRINKGQTLEHEKVMPIVMACMNMENVIPLNDVVSTGDTIDANLNQRLIENIFFKNSPLHDGAMVISNQRIKAAGCVLPVSHDMNIPKDLGLRHRAAMGISQVSDAIAIIVSEETGAISIAYKGQYHLKLTAEELESFLTQKIITDKSKI